MEQDHTVEAGDGTPEEPLFYPCKCSGSIKFVHQDCLMEWLSHSQKKHCELCKTPFRFTKLYDHNMPKTVPAYVFVSHIAKYIFRNILVWARAALVLMVWLVWLPYLMRRVWSALFWLSDEGLGPVWGRSDATSALASGTLSTSGAATCPSSPLSAESTTAATVKEIMSQVSRSAGSPTTTSLYGINITTDNPFYLGGSGIWDEATSHEVQSKATPIPTHQPTLLSDVKLLQKLSSASPALGGFAIDILEGQIITVLVIICFILIILVRDYVVQQQPDINMRAAFAAAENQDAHFTPNEDLAPGDADLFHGFEHEDDATSPHESSRQSSLPAHDSSGAAENYVRIYRQAQGDADEIRRIAREEHLEEELSYFLGIGKAQASRDQTEASAAETGESSNSGGLRRVSGWDWPKDGSEASGKGKTPVGNDFLTADGDQDHSSRPRSATDGPQVVGGVNPLGHNTCTLAESASSSAHGRTPSSSSSNDSIHSRTGTLERDALDAALETHRADDWETLSEFDAQTGEPQQHVDLDVPAEDLREVREHPPAAGFTQFVADFMWRDEQDAALALAEDHPQLLEQDQEVVAAAAAAGIDAEAEAIDDAEDLEGILELLGMRGPIAGLFQNALFCAFLVSITLFIGVFVPYNLGRLTIWVVANPIRPIRMIFSISSFVQDLAVLVGGLASTLVFGALNGLISFFRPEAPQLVMVRSLVQRSWALMENSGGRLRDSGMVDMSFCSAEELRNFSIVSHAALLTLKSQAALVLATIGKAILFVFGGQYSTKMAEIAPQAATASSLLWQALKDIPALFSIRSSWVIDFGTSETAVSLSPELASWGAMDRLWAILGGYIAMCVAAATYLGRGTPIAGRLGQEWEATLIDVLVQASGVMKVILIIGIEMLIFPLYCGLLLDVALLPLFEDTTIMSRAMFTVNYPLTSIFVHWFVGTGYMFHFALFVSMCRKIMRKGVLYFIRDPDDAEFHPVRDVLERNVTTQLRKILFSAFVYGALVIVCLGGVVWALSYGFQNVLPIYYSSNDPVLEFPIDLLFYNFLMPLAVKFFRPSDGLHAMYTWWFRKLARTLRLTWFLFGERRIDEEGTLELSSDSPSQALPLWKRLFLEVDGQAVVPKTWKDTFEGGHAKPSPPLSHERHRTLDTDKAQLVRTHQLIPDGRFVRAPASDQVKIPKGERVFFDVSELNVRQDDKPDRPATDLYSTNTYQFVYIPPNFRLRIFLFILFIWLFAAATGVGFTIIPLIFGRTLFRLFIPSDVRTNDIYAFSIGLYVLGSAFYLGWLSRDISSRAKAWLQDNAATLFNQETFQRVTAVAKRAAKLGYSYFFLLVVFPFMVSSLMELYLLIPLDTWMYGSTASNANDDAALHPRHTVRVMQSWTIGVIYLKLAARFVVHWHRDSRLAAAIRAVLRHGWLEPDVKVLTRAFVVPGLTLWLAAVFGPLMLAKMAIRYILGSDADTSTDAGVVLVYRFCFAAALLCAVALAIVRSILGVFRSWRVRIKDEAYLIGERLHNFTSPQQAMRETERERRRTRSSGLGRSLLENGYM
ncbi:hypothetical protein M406DRAFT_96511 [Cryphonectria parasitica EP155]|uniref:RING-type E3 ubiquitin transferase n=1 Tax=Cryphonectria parasitica (strain ATCC 38755 / EP155) TaxID=660469 RepID=A0A9P5CU20_CRYP1|nr:uncharacterized protein M406DRAFT_96511 [Cryphonectria parasitica EP155]KAF3769685.1 hypothetical protein M406DRAFT_96511 [Cryphonectria parasitica EP155]